MGIISEKTAEGALGTKNEPNINKGTKTRKIPNWLNGKESAVNNVQNIGNENTTAQVKFINKSLYHKSF